MNTLIIIIILSIIFIGISSILIIKQNNENFQTNSSFTSKILPIPPRRMWAWGTEVAGMKGYCGECCVQSVGLYYGNYISQGIANLASGGNSLLLNSTDAKACNNLCFQYVRMTKKCNLSELQGFFQQCLDLNWPIIFGWFDGPGEDNVYDHIMTIIGYDIVSSNSINNSTLSKLDVFDPTTCLNSSFDSSMNIYFNDNYTFDTVIGIGKELYQNRDNCANTGSCGDNCTFVQPFIYCLPAQVNNNCALIIQGNNDASGVLLPVRLIIDSPDEPDWGEQDKLYMQPKQINAQAIISELISEKQYALLSWITNASDWQVNPGKQPSNVPPDLDFLNGNYTTRQDFTPTSDTYTINGLNFMSNQAVFYRCIAI